MSLYKTPGPEGLNYNQLQKVQLIEPQLYDAVPSYQTTGYAQAVAISEEVARNRAAIANAAQQNSKPSRRNRLVLLCK